MTATLQVYALAVCSVKVSQAIIHQCLRNVLPGIPAFSAELCGIQKQPSIVFSSALLAQISPWLAAARP